jgi:hypothetical protein
MVYVRGVTSISATILNTTASESGKVLFTGEHGHGALRNGEELAYEV